MLGYCYYKSWMGERMTQLFHDRWVPHLGHESKLRDPGRFKIRYFLQIFKIIRFLKNIFCINNIILNLQNHFFGLLKTQDQCPYSIT